MVNFYQLTLELSTFLTLTSYASAFWWPAEEPIKQSSARASSPPSYDQSGYPQSVYPGATFSLRQGYPTTQQFASQSSWAGSWPPRPYYEYGLASNMPSVPIVPMQVPVQAGFGAAHVQNVQLVPCLCPVTTEYGYDTAPAQPLQPPPQTESDKVHSRKMFGRSQQQQTVISPIVQATNNGEDTR